MSEAPNPYDCDIADPGGDHTGHDHAGMTHLVGDDGGLVMIMDGIPAPLFGAAVATVIVISFVIVERFGLKYGEPRTIELTRRSPIRNFVRKPWFRFLFQAPVLLLFGFTIYAGLFGSFANNIAPVLVWTLWWAGLIFAVALLGNVWCFVCPWDALSDLASRLSFWKRKASLSLGLVLPKQLRNVYPAIALFVVLTWLEMGFGVTNNPRQTAYLGIGMAALAVGCALTFEKKAFCRSFCFVGRVSGMYSMFSPVELRARDTRACETCTTRDCLNGNEHGAPCPTGLDLGEMNESTYCTLCTDCVKTCPRNQPTFRIRSLGRDLSRVRTPRMDEAWLALTLLALTAFHGFSMTPVWENLIPGTPDFVSGIRAALGVGELAAFTVGMALVSAVPVAVYAACTWAAAAWTSATGVGFRRLFVGYAYSVLPVALFYHLAHNTTHIVQEGADVVPMLSDPLGRGADLFGTASMHVGALVSQETTWLIQIAMILVGHLFGITVAHRISRRLFDDPRAATRSMVPLLVMMVALSVGGLWLMHLDMNMRVGRM